MTPTLNLATTARHHDSMSQSIHDLLKESVAEKLAIFGSVYYQPAIFPHYNNYIVY